MMVGVFSTTNATKEIGGWWGKKCYDFGSFWRSGDIMKANGFTLLELMVVVTIVAILAAIAIPSFNEQARKSRRSEALQCLSDIQLRQEKWRSNHATYDDGTNIGVPSTANYTCAVTLNTAINHTSTATPVAGSPQAGDRCGTYTFRVRSGVLEKFFSGTGPCL